MTVNVVLSGLVAFAFFEPLAGVLGPLFAGTFLAGYEDALCLVFLFALSLGLLRRAPTTWPTPTWSITPSCGRAASWCSA